MKIGVDIRSLLEDHIGGVGHYTLNVLKALLRINRTHQFVLFSNSWGRDIPGREVWRSLGASCVHVSLPNKFLNAAFLLGFGPRLDELLGGVDIFWAPNLQFFSVSPFCRMIITCHDISFEHYPEFLSFKRRMWHRFVRPRRLYESFDEIVAVSQSTADDLQSMYGLPSDKIDVVYSGVDQDGVTDRDIHRVKSHYNFPQSFILTLGTLEPRKNLISVLQSFEWLVDHRAISEDLVIVGIKGWNYADIHSTWQKLRHKHRVHFLGYVPHRDRAPLYRLARLFVWPSFYEGFGFPPLESVAQGTPAIVGHHSSFPEIIGEAALMVDPYNIRGIADAMYELLTSKNLRQELIVRGRRLVQSFSWERTARNMEIVFAKVMARRK